MWGDLTPSPALGIQMSRLGWGPPVREEDRNQTQDLQAQPQTTMFRRTHPEPRSCRLGCWITGLGCFRCPEAHDLRTSPKETSLTWRPLKAEIRGPER